MAASLQPVCGGEGLLVRYHPVGGFGFPWTFIVLAERTGNVWTLVGGWGVFSREAYRAIRQALSDDGICEVIWRRGDGRQSIAKAPEVNLCPN